MLPKQDFVDRLHALRYLWGKPMIVTSAARCPSHNSRVLGSEDSLHLLGQAIDVRTNGVNDQAELEFFARICGFLHIGRYSSFLHIGYGRAATFNGAT